MPQKIQHIPVPLIQGEPDHVFLPGGILHEESGFTIARVGMDIGKAASGQGDSFKQAGTVDCSAGGRRDGANVFPRFLLYPGSCRRAGFSFGR